METKITPAPCPCCGNKMLYVGELDDQVFGVRCPAYESGCGLELGLGLSKKTLELPDMAIDTEMIRCQLEAIKRWNRRQQQIIPSSLMDALLDFNKEMAKKVIVTKKKKVKK
jgi:hypothetical protein